MIDEFINSLTEEEIKKLLKNIPYWMLGDQWLPAYTTSGTRVVNIRELRKVLLGKRYPGELKLMSYCKGIFSDLLEQYPFLITERSYWIDLVKSLDLPSEYLGRGVFFVDGFSPSRNLAIEADYPSTHSDKYDMARDTYLRNIHGIDFRRIRGYGQDKKGDEKIEKFIQELKSRYDPFTPIDYTKVAIKKYLLFNYSGLYDSLEKISLGRNPGPTYKKLCKWLGRKA